MPLELWLIYASTLTLATLLPGPSSILALSCGVRFGTARSSMAVLGITAASLVQGAAAICGLKSVLFASETLFYLIKLFGAAYLIYIGLSIFRTREMSLDGAVHGPAQGPGGPGLFRQGFFTAMGNPKAIVFFTSLFPQFIEVGGNELLSYLILMTTLAAVAFGGGLLYATCGWSMSSLFRFPGVRKYFHKAVGTIFIGAGLGLAASNR